MTETPELAAVPPNPTPEPVAPAESAEVTRLRAHAAKLLDEAKKAKDQARETSEELQRLKDERATAQESNLVEQQQFKTLWEQAQETNTELRNELAVLRRESEEARLNAESAALKAKFTAAAANSDMVAPDQFYELNKANIRQKDGKPVYLLGGVETDLKSALDTLKQPGSMFEHFFRASGVGGMGAGGTATTGTAVTSASSNPYMSGNVTARLQLELENPQLAEQLKAQAAASRS